MEILFPSGQYFHHYVENALTYFVRSSVFFISPERTKWGRSTTRKSLLEINHRRLSVLDQNLVTGNVFSG
jgi:hypothetical protein